MAGTVADGPAHVLNSFSRASLRLQEAGAQAEEKSFMQL